MFINFLLTILLLFFHTFSESPIEEVTDALYGKWRNFMMTHNLELKMPEMLFDGATFRITPRAFDGDGALVKFEMIPKQLQEVEPDSTGRLFGLKKHISKFFKSKCTTPSCPTVVLVCWLPLLMFPKSTHSHMHKHNSHSLFNSFFFSILYSFNRYIFFIHRKILQK